MLEKEVISELGVSREKLWKAIKFGSIEPSFDKDKNFDFKDEEIQKWTVRQFFRRLRLDSSTIEQYLNRNISLNECLNRVNYSKSDLYDEQVANVVNYYEAHNQPIIKELKEISQIIIEEDSDLTENSPIVLGRPASRKFAIGVIVANVFISFTFTNLIIMGIEGLTTQAFLSVGITWRILVFVLCLVICYVFLFFGIGVYALFSQTAIFGSNPSYSEFFIVDENGIKVCEKTFSIRARMYFDALLHNSVDNELININYKDIKNIVKINKQRYYGVVFMSAQSDTVDYYVNLTNGKKISLIFPLIYENNQKRADEIFKKNNLLIDQGKKQ